MDILDILRVNEKRMEDEYREISQHLQKFGLSEYESRVYIGLVAMEQGTAEEISESSSVPRTSTYKVLESLEEKGYVDSVQGRPRTYFPAPPSELKEELQDELITTFDKLTNIQGIFSDKGTPQLVYTIAGRERILSKIGNMVDSSMKSILLSSPSISHIRKAHEEKFQAAVERKVSVIIVAEPFTRLPPNTHSYRKEGLMATDMITDGDMALIASPDLSLCGYTDNPFLSEHLENIFRSTLAQLE